MTLKEAQGIIREVEGRSYWYLKEWGLSIIKEAIRTIRNRKSSTKVDLEYANGVSLKICLEGD